MSKIAGLCGLAFVTLLGSALPSWAVSQPPAVPFGCVGVGDYRYEDVWHVCPDKQACWRWNGYGGIRWRGGWVDCYSAEAVGEPPRNPCKDAGYGQFKCGFRVITCGSTACH